MDGDTRPEGRRGSRPRSRSRSPLPEFGHRIKHSRRRSHRDHEDKHKKPKNATSVSAPKPLPFGTRQLGKSDYKVFKPMFALYLDIQKGLVLEDLDNGEVKGRWKSFVGKWNRGELAEGWYDPATLHKAVASASTVTPRFDSPPRRRSSPSYGRAPTPEAGDPGYSSDDDGPGPALPDRHLRSPRKNARSGPAIPTIHDLELKRELAQEDSLEAREAMRLERRANRGVEKERLDELVPRAEAGTRERQLEKKREVASSNRAFAAAKEAGDVVEVPDSDLMGGGDDLEGFKKQKNQMERKKNERELRRDEIMRARKEEQEERAREFREREERTMKGLVELARKRFG